MGLELELILIRAHDGQKAGLAISDDVVGEVISVHKDSPAEACGLRPYDRIIAVDGLECTTAQPAPIPASSVSHQGSAIKVSVIRLRYSRASNASAPKLSQCDRCWQTGRIPALMARSGSFFSAPGGGVVCVWFGGAGRMGTRSDE